MREIIGDSKAMTDIMRTVAKIATTESTVVIHGESGTGKELIARDIHFRSSRKRGPFVTVNSGAIPRELIESTLFGHVRGAFTGADRDKDGLFQVAEGGTFFLDEVGELTLPAQVKLLRALQEREVVPVGGTVPKRIDCRVIAATNIDLELAVAEKRFRSDLYYRLSVIAVRIPPLRDRREDIRPLVAHFLHKPDGPHARISNDAMNTLNVYPWPGNVRELENAIEHAVAMCEGRVIELRDLPSQVQLGASGGQMGGDDRIQSVMRQHIAHVMSTSRTKREAAQRLGINQSTLYRMVVDGAVPKALKRGVV